MFDYKEKEAMGVGFDDPNIGFFAETAVNVPERLLKEFEGVLLSDESIIAAAEGKTGKGNIALKMFAVCWTAFAVFWTVGASMAGGLFGLFGVPFILVGIGQLKSAGFIRRKIQVAVTGKRVIFRCGRQIGAVYHKDRGDVQIFPSADPQMCDVMFDWITKKSTNALVREIAAGGICSMSAEDAENIATAINDQRSIR